ncbi:hypothetical protein M0P65_04820 [Candidatus Gracilibacteria bacterium]|nr:hypothetical protein [Candidatus Gracilibacteria bacterium]
MSGKNSLNYEVRNWKGETGWGDKLPNVFSIRERAKIILDIQNSFGSVEELDKYQEISNSLRDLFVNGKNVLSENEFDLIKRFITIIHHYDVDYNVFLQAIFRGDVEKINEFKSLLKENGLNLGRMWSYMFVFRELSNKVILPSYKDFLKYGEIQGFDKNGLGTIEKESFGLFHKKKEETWIIKLNRDGTLVETDKLEECDNTIPFIEDLRINIKGDKLQLATITPDGKVLILVDWCPEKKFMKATLGEIIKKAQNQDK